MASMASSSVSSPGIKPPPMNFDFKPVTVDGDSTIVHPIPVKLPMDNPPTDFSSDESSLGRKNKPTGNEELSTRNFYFQMHAS